MGERGEPGDVGRVGVSLLGEVIEGCLHLDRLPEHDDVDHDAEGVELVFLPDLIVLAQLTALAVEEVAGQGITRFASIEHPVDRPAVGRGPAVLARAGS
jgi:hypothetical protein